MFTNRRHNRVKVLYWDGTGLWVMTKRLEKGTFSWPEGMETKDGKLSLSSQALGH
ncbi:MAG: IS66 family insertion sequence element accessory protein TnpB [bacterium]